MLETVSLAGLAERLDDAARNVRAVSQPSEPLTLTDAYEVQRLSLERRVARGERRTGMKIGFTSKAKLLELGLEDMIWGRLTDAMLVDDGATIDFERYLQPRVEPEIAFLLARPLAGRVSSAEAVAALAGIAPALEIIDSRYQSFKFSLGDVVADNSSSSGYVLGPLSPPETDLSNLGMVLELDGRAVQIGSSAAILDHPLRSLVAAARLASAAGEPLRAGDVVMGGAAMAAEALAPGSRVRLSVDRLGEVSFFVSVPAKSRGDAAG